MKLPASNTIGAAEGCELVRDVPKDATLTYDDVKLPAGRLVDELLAAQANLPASIPPICQREPIAQS